MHGVKGPQDMVVVPSCTHRRCDAYSLDVAIARVLQAGQQKFYAVICQKSEGFWNAKAQSLSGQTAYIYSIILFFITIFTHKA